jgi:hypothetical protein
MMQRGYEQIILGIESIAEEKKTPDQISPAIRQGRLVVAPSHTARTPGALQRKEEIHARTPCVYSVCIIPSYCPIVARKETVNSDNQGKA